MRHKGKHFVVVHDSVERFNPLWIDITVKNNPLVLLGCFVFFAAGGIVTPADAALCMELGSESIFVGSGIFLSEDPAKRARAIVEAVNHWKDPKKLAEISEDLGESMK